MADESVGSAAKLEELKEKFQKDPASASSSSSPRSTASSTVSRRRSRSARRLQKHPTYTSARVTLARSYTGAKRYDEAKAEFEKVIAAVPDNLLANRCLGDLYDEEGRNDEALGRYRVVQMLNPGDEEVARASAGSRPAGPVCRGRPRVPYLFGSPGDGEGAGGGPPAPGRGTRRSGRGGRRVRGVHGPSNRRVRDPQRRHGRGGARAKRRRSRPVGRRRSARRHGSRAPDSDEGGAGDAGGRARVRR